MNQTPRLIPLIYPFPTLENKKGEIAGRNVIRELNKYPVFSENDTLHMVAHIIRLPYAKGMIVVLRGKINFDGFYTVALKMGKVTK